MFPQAACGDEGEQWGHPLKELATGIHLSLHYNTNSVVFLVSIYSLVSITPSYLYESQILVCHAISPALKRLQILIFIFAACQCVSNTDVLVH